MPNKSSNATAASGGSRRKRKPGSAGNSRTPAPKGAKPVQARPRARLPAKRDFNALPQYLKCVLDPFSMPACGFPDNFAGNTSKIKAVESYVLTTDAAGTLAHCVGPSLQRARYSLPIAAGLTGNAAGETITAHGDYAAIAAVSPWARMSCFGIKVEYIGAATTASGTLTVVKDPLEYAWVSTDVSTLSDDGATRRADQGRMIPMPPNMAARFENVAGTSFENPTFNFCYLLFQGLPASAACIRVTTVRHIELLPTKASVLTRGQTSRTPAQPLTLAALSNLDPDVQSVVSDVSWSGSLADWAGALWDGLSQAAEPLVHSAASGLASGALSFAEASLGGLLL